MNRQYAATLLDPETSTNLVEAMRAGGKTCEEINSAIDEALRMGAEALREIELMEDDGK